VGRFFDALKAGVKGFQTANDPVAYTIADKQIRCPHCGVTNEFTSHHEPTWRVVENTMAKARS
jgi:hypothetical protein